MTRQSIETKLAILSDAAKYDASCASSGSSRRDSSDGKGLGSNTGAGICHAYAPDGRCISLLKILMTNFCIYDCAYCINRVSSNVPRARFSVDEVVTLTVEFYRRNYIEGLFLSSGVIRSPDATMEAMVEIVRKLREEENFRGYIHLKTIPDAAPELIAEAGRLADRLSINVELPTDSSVQAYAPEKDPHQIRRAMADVRLRKEAAGDRSHTGRKPPCFAPAGQSTQVIIGADGANDATILGQSTRLYSSYKLKRVYYSAFSPIPDSSAKLPLIKPPLEREHRLYQADWLLRFYGFDLEEITGVTADGNLDLEIDPKLAWALAHRAVFPVDINRAAKELLLRVPGFGVKTVKRILTTRRHRRVRYDDIARMGASMKKAGAFITAEGVDARRLDRQRDAQAAFCAATGAVVAVLMRHISLPDIGTAAAWRDAARACLAARLPPDAVSWGEEDTDPGLFGATHSAAENPAKVTVPRSFIALAETVCWHRDPEQFARLYGFLWRLKDAPQLMTDRGDVDLARLRVMEKAVHRCQHKMTAFVRFRELGMPNDPRRSFAAWFEPTHYTLEPTAPFFAKRFGDMDWQIVTPEKTAVFANGEVSFGAGQRKPDLPEDASEALWLTYFRNIFNPTRLKVRAMQSEMPRKYWKNMPEAAAIPDLIASAPARARAMAAATPTLPPARTERVQRQLQTYRSAWEGPADALPAAIRACTRCPLHATATQAVPGEGPLSAALMIVGEQPGDHEDLAGRPFVGPAGQLFDKIAEKAGLDRAEAFVTNAVKHFKFTPRGKRRIHQRPNAGEVQHCQWWLEAERATVRPRLILTMGSTAAAALTGSGKDMLRRRGSVEELADGTPVLMTVHPSYLLRLRDTAAKAKQTAAFLQDLRLAKTLLDEAGQT